MNLSSLKPAVGSIKSEKRIGRGQGSGKGGTSTKGHKGQKAQSGYNHRRGYEGGQMPLHRRIPKFGFKNINRIEYKAINLSTIETLAKDKNLSEITKEILYQAGLVAKKDNVKILGNGALTVKVNVKADAFSKSAIKAIEDLGGKADVPVKETLA